MAEPMITIAWASGAVLLPEYEYRERAEPGGGTTGYMEQVSAGRVLSEEDWRTVRRAREIMGRSL